VIWCINIYCLIFVDTVVRLSMAEHIYGCWHFEGKALPITVPLRVFQGVQRLLQGEPSIAGEYQDFERWVKREAIRERRMRGGRMGHGRCLLRGSWRKRERRA
jgi:hypothetical protein